MDMSRIIVADPRFSVSWQLVREAPPEEIPAGLLWPKFGTERRPLRPDEMKRAVSLPCPLCEGIGKLAFGHSCPACKGEGTRKGISRLRLDAQVGDTAAVSRAKELLAKFGVGGSSVQLLLRFGVVAGEMEGQVTDWVPLGYDRDKKGYVRGGYRPVDGMRNTIRARCALGVFVERRGATISGYVRFVEAMDAGVLADGADDGAAIHDVWTVSGTVDEPVLHATDAKGAAWARRLGTDVQELAIQAVVQAAKTTCSQEQPESVVEKSEKKRTASRRRRS